MEEQTIVIKDSCDDDILGVLTVYGKDKENVAQEVERVKTVFNEVYKKLDDCWTMDDLIDALEESGMSFSWATDVKVMTI